MWWALLAPALADDLDNWQALQGALLGEAIDGDLTTSMSSYSRLVGSLANDDPARTEALYWLARARYVKGDIDGARDALRKAIASPSPSRGRCLDLLGEIELEQSAIHALPSRWSFDAVAGATPENGFVHPAAYSDKGSLRVDQVVFGDENPALVWTTQVDPRKEDLIVVGLRVPAPKLLQFRVRATNFDARLRVALLDTAGRRWWGETSGYTVSTDAWTTIAVDFSTLRPEEGSGRLNPSAIDQIVLIDATAGALRRTGENSLVIDDFEVN